MSHLFSERLETERLVLEKVCPENVTTHELYDLFSGQETSDVFEHVPQSPYRSLDEPREMIENAAESWRDGAIASYAVRPSDGEPDAGALAGTALLYPEWEKRSARLGLILGKRFWGRGYSGERASALMAMAFDRLGLELVSVSHNAGNTKSRRAIEKYVERFGGEHDCLLRNWVPMDDEVNDVHRYTITREQWKASREEDES
ncbi:GNAT family N-acetyltransferase [Haladaptatus sp. AB643]|uniref:GNAT family N-acetyltransferase n=1 Tax=unclassified Haladaptatus TaxID=2622732 RepID=UPI00209C27D3|nr:GNAT family N-acetyltransferase [Haladaptatus sp. AB643]MCO8253122.1 GNAT family N-acetyltransferase [Haladaptatus sp. AB618]